jgi:Ran GTPase-activating protein (RanGAP) involved in mRNA processing and transport
MNDIDSDSDSISDSSNAHSDVLDAGGYEALIPTDVRELCSWLRANDPRVLNYGSVFELLFDVGGCNGDDAGSIEIFQALKENTSVKHIDFRIFFEPYFTTGKRTRLAAAEYVESSKTLQTLDLNTSCYVYPQDCEMLSTLLRALSRNTSVTKLIINTGVVKIVSDAFQELLTRTQTLQKMKVIHNDRGTWSQVQISAIASSFASNTTLRDLELKSWREADLTPVLKALQRHPALEKIHISAGDSDMSFDHLPSLSGLGVLLRSQDSKAKELILEEVDTTRTVGLHQVLQELGCNTTVTDLSIRDSVLSRENVQQVKSVLRHNTALRSLNLASCALESAGLADIAPVLYRNSSVKTLDLSNNSLDEVESANLLRELLRRNRTITSICLAENTFGGSAAAARSIFEGFRCNTALQQLDLTDCGLGDQDISFLAKALAVRNTSILELNLQMNEITSVGVRALFEGSAEAVKTLTKLRLLYNPIKSEGAIILVDALERNTMPSLKQLYLCMCDIEDDGVVALVSSLEQNNSLQSLNLAGNQFGKRGFMALAESLPNIKGLHQVDFAANASFQSTLPLLLQGFRMNTSLVKVNILIIFALHWGGWSQELRFLGQRNRFTPLLKTSNPPGESPQLGIWPRALAKVATEPDVLFHVLRNKPKLVGSTGSSQKRKRNER